MHKSVMIALALAGFAGESLAADFVMPMNTTRQVGVRYSLHEDCTSAGETVIRITGAPTHGNVAVKTGSDYPNYPLDNPRKICNARKVKSTQVWYTPQRNFVGSDTISVDVLYPSGNSVQTTYTIAVR